jgi:hypothetical protein
MYIKGIKECYRQFDNLDEKANFLKNTIFQNSSKEKEII